MIVWINGAFGAGKSTLAAGLHTALSQSVLADPEDIGALLRQSMAGHYQQLRDYQDYPAWRRLTVHLITELHQLAGGPVIVPMTILSQAYARDMFTPLSRLGTAFHHLVFHADPARSRPGSTRASNTPGTARAAKPSAPTDGAAPPTTNTPPPHGCTPPRTSSTPAPSPPDRPSKPLSPTSSTPAPDRRPATLTTLTARTVRLGTRPSPMAMEQTTRFAHAFRAQYPDITLDIRKITSEGDAHHGPLSQIGGKGAFCLR